MIPMLQVCEKRSRAAGRIGHTTGKAIGAVLAIVALSFAGAGEVHAVILAEPDATSILDPRYLNAPLAVPQSVNNLWATASRVATGEIFTTPTNGVWIGGNKVITMNALTHSDGGPMSYLQFGTGNDASNSPVTANVTSYLNSPVIDASVVTLDTDLSLTLGSLNLVRAANKPEYGETLWVFAFGTVGLPGQPLQTDPFKRGFQMSATFPSTVYGFVSPDDYGSGRADSAGSLLDLAGGASPYNSGCLVLNSNYEWVGLLKLGGSGAGAYLMTYTRTDMQAAKFNQLLQDAGVIPEPSSAALLMCGALALSASRSRSRRAR